jgi:hypothetical protein
MLKPSVAACFNPSCASRFRRLGDGRLFIEPIHEFEKGQERRVIWLCGQCSQEHTLRYDWERKDFVLTGFRPHGRRIA